MMGSYLFKFDFPGEITINHRLNKDRSLLRQKGGGQSGNPSCEDAMQGVCKNIIGNLCVFVVYVVDVREGLSLPSLLLFNK